MFIETPYRNNQMLKDLLASCSPQTRVLVAMDITGPEEFIKTKTVEQWKRKPGTAEIAFTFSNDLRSRQETGSLY